MALDRGPWNALVDDDGSNLTGTLWNKDAIKTVILDPTDAAILAPPGAVRVGTAHADGALAGGNVDNYRPPNGENCYIWILALSGPQSITGILAEANYTQHLLINITGQNLVLYHQHAQSAPANRLFCPGFNHYTLGSWGSIPMTYIAGLGGWVLHKAT